MSNIINASAPEMRPLPILDDVTATDIPNHPDIEWLPLDHLFMNPAYQRDILRTGKTTIRKIASNFQWARFGIVTVMRQGAGRFVIIDGQHRCAALKSMGARLAPCLVIPEGNLREQALHFIGINTDRTALTPVAKFKARIMAGDTAAIALYDFVKSCDVKPLLYQPNPKFVTLPSINAYNTLEKIFSDSLCRTLFKSALMIAAAISAPLIRGEIVTILFNYLSYPPAGATTDPDVLIAALSSLRPAQIVALVRDHRDGTGDTIKDSHSLVIWRLVEDYLDKTGADNAT